ncbi:MAG: carbohydrate-binding domain-containing protein [Eggerthellaceae bacterium]|nr:carbohydrate-binding domain-containing protein [Eggerthellaceae bacterium]
MSQYPLYALTPDHLADEGSSTTMETQPLAPGTTDDLDAEATDTQDNQPSDLDAVDSLTENEGSTLAPGQDIPLAEQPETIGVAPLQVGTVHGPYTVTNVFTYGEILAAGVYEVTGGSGVIYVDGGSAVNPVVIVLNGVNRSSTISQLQLLKTSFVILYLAEGTQNAFTSTNADTGTGAMSAGIYVAEGASLTIEGPGALTATGGLRGAGIGGISTSTFTPSGAITIKSGKVTAHSGQFAAAIGGGYHGSSTSITITGGTVAATSTLNGAAIGGGDNGAGGTISITGGIVSAISESAGAGIGGGRNGNGGVITISGGEVKATCTTTIGVGIGSGTGTGCGTITITGGSIIAEGVGQYAGIGAGTGSAATGTINISGGTIRAKSGDATASGVGGGTGNQVAVLISGGSVYSVDSTGKIGVNYNPRNGTNYGNDLVYLLQMSLSDHAGAALPYSEISIDVAKSVPYTYRAMTNGEGKAYLWLPESSVAFLTSDPESGEYFDYLVDITATPSQGYENIPVSLGHPVWSFSAEGDGDAKTYASQTLLLDIVHDNPGNHPEKAIADVKWFRESVESPQNTRETFDAGFDAADPGNKGTGGSGEELNLTSVFDANEQHFALNATMNGRYWVQIHYKGANTGADVYHVAHLDVDNIFTPISIFVQDMVVGDATVLRPYTKLTLENGAVYGARYDFDGTLLSSPRFGPDTVAYERNALIPVSHWDMAVPGRPFEATAGNAASAQIVLDATIDESEDATPQSDATNKYYTVSYARSTNWSLMPVTFVDAHGNAFGIPLGSNNTGMGVWVPLDENASTATGFKANGATFMPPSDGIHGASGYYIAPAPHTVPAPTDGTDPHTYFSQPDFADFDPSLSFSNTATGELAGGNMLFVVYSASYMIDVSVPVSLMFAAFESDGGKVTAPEYAISNNGKTDVTVTLVGLQAGSADGGLNLTENPANAGDIGLALASIDAPALFDEVPLATATNVELGVLGGVQPFAASSFMRLTLTGKYVGSFDVPKTLNYTLVFEFSTRGS